MDFIKEPSVVKWNVPNDMWFYEEDIVPPPTNPYANMGHGTSVATWNVPDDVWGQIVKMTMFKHFLKAGDVIYSLDSDGRLLSPQVSAIPTKQEFEDYGMDNLTGMFAPMNTIQYTMTEVDKLGEGMTFSQKITPAEFSRQIKRIRSIGK